MYQRDHDHRELGQTRPPAPPRRLANPVHALQRAIGNRGTVQVLARQKNRAQFEHSIKVGKLPLIEIKGGNLSEWVAGKVPETLTLTTTKGKHSEDLKRMADARTRLDVVEVSTVIGENTIMVITFKPARLIGYAAGDGKTEDWKIVDFQDVKRAKTSIGSAR
jgi:hypothetical protein